MSSTKKFDSASEVEATSGKLKSNSQAANGVDTALEQMMKEKALELYYAAREKTRNNLPQSTRKFCNVAKLAVQRMQEELDADAGKSAYKDYIRIIENYLISIYGNYDIANVDVKLLQEYESWRDKKMGREKMLKRPTSLHGKSKAQIEKAVLEAEAKFRAAHSTINTHNSAINSPIGYEAHR